MRISTRGATTALGIFLLVASIATPAPSRGITTAAAPTPDLRGFQAIEPPATGLPVSDGPGRAKTPALGNHTTPAPSAAARPTADASAAKSPVTPTPPPGPAATPRQPGLTGTATWYCLPGVSRCTAGLPGGHYAAVRRDLLYLRGRNVTVCGPSDTCVSVRVVDCNCGGPGANLIDLYADAFRDLAPLGAGRIAVTVYP